MAQQDPQWGRRNNDGPPDLDEIFRNFKRRLQQFFGGKGSAQDPEPPAASAVNGGLIIAGLIFVFLWLSSGFYVVDEREDAVLIRFGSYLETVKESGLHWHMPYPIERAEIVNVTEYRSLKLGVKGEAGTAQEALMVTGDQNLIEVQLEIQFNVKDAKDYAFNNLIQEKDGRDLVRQVAQTAVREVVGRSRVDSVLNEDRGAIADTTKSIMQVLLDKYGSGISLSRLNILDVQPPEQVQEAFADAVKARQDKVRLINEGKAYSNDVVPKAAGISARLKEEAEAYKSRVVSTAEGDASRFKQVAAEYAKAPVVTRERMYLEAMQQIYTNTTKVLVDQKSGAGNFLYLPLDKLIQLSGQGTSVADNTNKPAADPSGNLESGPRARLDLSVRGEREGR
ncbi:FtsH protease activity modulator HflK [Parachitinimonas caeni]|uniref:Protein HflK n=1 Tax=Parachitinimonas caeni TaxID=3031301 RepID=A0ABT7DTC2_9NEIS|nr:FtsH protease activity modulator HflK [Parachitinimonas caeni]MDK2123321.1 FtsH protease activity modulator HflK [Parachitinimonas caeni]